MNRVVLCGNSGGDNRGCEAIVRSTAKIFKLCGIKDIVAFSFQAEHDIELGLDKLIDIRPYSKVNKLHRVYYWARRKLLKDYYCNAMYQHEAVKKELRADDLVINVGGDTYCYPEPSYVSYTLNLITEKRKIKNVFWGCSVDDRLADDEEKQRDINRYYHIVTRESYTEEIVKKFSENKAKVLRACDPAFWLDIEETSLPQGFLDGNTVGINLSPLVFEKMEGIEASDTYKNVICLIDYILKKTDMNICLIPHVYNARNNSADLEVLNKIKSVYAEDKRVSIVIENLNCCQLKYIISRCRFFVGARTHSTIAAYSTHIPTIVLGYSIKSRGIAYDLFGTEDGYVVSWKDLTSPGILRKMFRDMQENEEKIKSHYADVMPGYKESVMNVAKSILGELFCE